MGDPYVLDLSHNNKIFNPLAKSIHHKVAPSDAQATGDWRRNKDFYYINGKSVDSIATEMKAKKLQAAVEEFLATDDADAKVSWQDYCQKLFPRDGATVNFALAQKIIIHTEDLLADNEGVSDCLNAVDTDTPAMKKLKENIIKPITLLFEDKMKKSSRDFLREMWETYLLPGMDEKKQADFIKVLFNYGHQGGVLHSFSTAMAEKILLAQINAAADQDRNAVIDYNQVITDNTLTHFIIAENMMPHCVVNVSFADDKIFIHETTPITTLLKRTDLPTLDTVRDITYPHEFTLPNGNIRKRDMYLMEPETIHSLQPLVDTNGDLSADVSLVLVRENIYSDLVLPTLSHVYTEDIRNDMQKYFDLVNYANSYIEEGTHDAALAEELIKKYPDISTAETTKKSYFSLHASQSKTGDKVLNYLGEHYPSYFTNLMSRQQEYMVDEKRFTYFFKLLVRLGNVDAEHGHDAAAKELLQNYMDKVGVRIKLPETVLTEPLIKQIFDALGKAQFFASIQLPVPRNIFAEDKNIFQDQAVIAKMKNVLDDFVNYTRLNHPAADKSSKLVSSPFIGEASSMFFSKSQIQEKRAAKAFLNYIQYDPEASMSAFRAKIFLYCILAYENKFPDLSKKMRKEFPKLTLDGLRKELHNELKFRGCRDDFATLNKDVIVPITMKVTRLTESQMDNPLREVLNKLEKFNGPQVRHRPRI